MSNNYEFATVTPYFPPLIVAAHSHELDELNVQYEDDGYIYVEDGCHDWDAFIAILQKMMKETEGAGKVEYCMVEGAMTCDKMRQGEFGGFAQFITPDDCLLINTGSWLFRREEFFKKKQKNPDFMDIQTAMQIVYDLADQNALDQGRERVYADHDEDMQKEMVRQRNAIDTVHDFIVNHFAEDEVL